MLSSVDDKKVVVCGFPSKFAVDPWMNPEPVNVRDVPGDPTATELGEMLLSDGGIGGGVEVPELPPLHPSRDVNRTSAPTKVT